MTTYTIIHNGETYLECSIEMLKRMRKQLGTKNVKAVKNEAPKFWYYRGEMVALIEDVTNGWTLVSSPDGSRQFRAVTAELECR